MPDGRVYTCDIGCTITLPDMQSIPNNILVRLDELGFGECGDCDRSNELLASCVNNNAVVILACEFTKIENSHKDLTRCHYCNEVKCASNIRHTHEEIEDPEPLEVNLTAVRSEVPTAGSEPRSADMDQFGSEDIFPLKKTPMKTEPTEEMLLEQEDLEEHVDEDAAADLEDGESQVEQSKQKNIPWEDYEDKIVITCASQDEAVAAMMERPDNRRVEGAIRQRWTKHKRKGKLLLIGDIVRITGTSKYYREKGKIVSINDDHTDFTLSLISPDSAIDNKSLVIPISDVRRWDE